MKTSGDRTVLLRWSVEVNRDDLERNDIIKPPEEWEPNDLAHADSLGLIYAWEIETEEQTAPLRPRERNSPVTDPNDPITVTASRQSWQALTRLSPLSEMTYTPDGIAAYEAFQAIQQALHGPQGPEAGT